MRASLAILGTGLRTIPIRYGPVVVMFVGIAGVVGVITGMLALGSGLSKMLTGTARDDRAVILSEHARFVNDSSLSPDHLGVIATAPGIASATSGEPAVMKDVRVSVVLRGKTDAGLKGVVVRGLSPVGLELRQDVRLVSGRMFRTGIHEVVVGRHAQAQFRGAAVGDRLRLPNVWMEIVGVFESEDWLESGFLADADTLLAATGQRSANAAVAQLEDPRAFVLLQEALSIPGPLRFQVLRETDYVDRLTDAFSLVERVAVLVSAIVAIGGVFCTFNVMYAAVGARESEIVLYRVLGFGSAGVVASVVLESLLVAISGALVGAGLTWLLFNGAVVTTGSYDVSIVHGVTVSWGVVLQGVLCAMVVATCGAALPAVEAARKPLTTRPSL